MSSLTCCPFGEDLRRMRGSEAAMVFQEPNSVLNPVYTIGWQIEEGLRAHGMKDKKGAVPSVDILKVGILMPKLELTTIRISFQAAKNSVSSSPWRWCSIQV